MTLKVTNSFDYNKAAVLLQQVFGFAIKLFSKDKILPPCSMFGIPVSTSAAISGYRLSVERITRLRRDWKFLSVFSFLPTSSHLKGLRTTWTASQIFQNKTRTLCSRQILVFYASIHFRDLITMNYYASFFSAGKCRPPGQFERRYLF